MTDAELVFIVLAELSVRQIAETTQSKGLEENKIPAKKGGKVAKNARLELEQKTGKKVKKFFKEECETKRDRVIFCDFLSMISALELDVDIDRAIRFLAEYLPVSDASSRKPILPHNVRVGMFLRDRVFLRGYSKEAVLAGFLHDVIEWSNANEEMLRRTFGDEVTRLVRASTKDDSIKDGRERCRELVDRCAREGLEAFVVKAADILDSFRFYTEVGNDRELSGHCMPYADALLRAKPAEWSDPIFHELRVWEGKRKS